jgi:hypothetical protein
MMMTTLGAAVYPMLLAMLQLVPLQVACQFAMLVIDVPKPSYHHQESKKAMGIATQQSQGVPSIANYAGPQPLVDNGEDSGERHQDELGNLSRLKVFDGANIHGSCNEWWIY